MTSTRYLDGCALRAARDFGAGTQAAVTVRDHGMVVPAASSHPGAARCAQVEVRADGGPSLRAMRDVRAVVVAPLEHDPRWPAWRAQALAEGFRSAVAMPADAAPAVDAVLTLYSREPDRWGPRALRDAGGHARRVAYAIGLRVQVALLDPLTAAEDLTGTQVIEQAVGATMQSAHCTADEARDLLAAAAQDRGVGLEEVAGDVLMELTGPRTPHRPLGPVPHRLR